MITIGMKHEIEKVVTADMTAKAVGSGGLEVFGTPFMMGMMECAAMWCIQPELPEGKGTVGVDIQSSHLAPTPVGMKVRATAEVTAISENGKMVTFKVAAYDEEGLIGEGTHTRAIISNERFFKKCNEKLARVQK
ncbi:MAG: thioesterase family protein [Clostridiales bacterium]|nr:thioesterase family protein [Candidatus Cacconaster stercorequi]